MKPAASIILFTTLAGAAQGVVVVLAAASLANAAPAALSAMLWVTAAMLLAGLVASFFHLGHPTRAWRTVLMWRTSWMSREVIVLPAFIALVVVWALVGESKLLAVLAIAGALALWYCTAMIYACIRFIQEWAHRLTIVNYVTLGLASGCIVAGALSAWLGDAAFARAVAGWAIAATWLAWFTRTLSLRRNAKLVPKSTLQTATGIQAARLVQTAMGMTGGSFNTREFFHGAPLQLVRHVKLGFQLLAFAAPLVLLAWAAVSGSLAAWTLALLTHAIGMLAERWFFFAQARHPQNLYYQAVS